MNHWHAVGQLGAGHRADMERDAAGGVRMRAAGFAEGGSADGVPATILGRPSREGRRRLNELRLVLMALVAHGRRLLRGYQDAESTDR